MIKFEQHKQNRVSRNSSTDRERTGDICSCPIQNCQKKSSMMFDLIMGCNCWIEEIIACLYYRCVDVWFSNCDFLSLTQFGLLSNGTFYGRYLDDQGDCWDHCWTSFEKKAGETIDVRIEMKTCENLAFNSKPTHFLRMNTIISVESFKAEVFSLKSFNGIRTKLNCPKQIWNSHLLHVNHLSGLLQFMENMHVEMLLDYWCLAVSFRD